MHQESGCDGEPLQPWPWAADNAPIVLILVGLIASGKSTFAKALEQNVPQFKRCNQDELGNRQAVERLARETLRNGLSVCIDRTNFDQTQRAHWIQIAREIPETKIWCLVFDTPLNVCKDRLQYRTDHPTIHSIAQGEQVLYRFAKMYRAPTAEEGFDRIYNLKPQAHPSPTYSTNELLALLAQIANSPPPEISTVQLEIGQFVNTGNAGQSWQSAGRRGSARPRRSWGSTRARGGSRVTERGDNGFVFGRYADHGRGGTRGVMAAPTLSAGGGAGRGYSRNTIPQRSEISSSWRHDRSKGAQECETQSQDQETAGSSSLRSPDRQSQSTTQPGDAQFPTRDIANNAGGSAEHPITVD